MRWEFQGACKGYLLASPEFGKGECAGSGWRARREWPIQMTGARRMGYPFEDYAPRRVEMSAITERVDTEKHIAAADRGEFGLGLVGEAISAVKHGPFATRQEWIVLPR